MNDDAELLRRYVVERSESAFAELVKRHLDLVYYSALRQNGGNCDQAQDTAQTVFVLLAQKAPTLVGHPSLAGWLYVTTHRKVSETLRVEHRRQARERELAMMAKDASAEANWNEIRPELDAVILKLSRGDREALLLRFFEGQSFAEVAAALALTEAAARKRVARALEKMRQLLGRRGIVSSAGALAVILGGQGMLAAPAGLAATVTGTAALTVTAGLTPLASLQITLTRILMATTKLKVSLAAIMAASVVGTFVLYQDSTRRQLQQQLGHVQTDNDQLNAAARLHGGTRTRMNAALANAQTRVAALLQQLKQRAKPASGAPAPSRSDLLPNMKSIDAAANVGQTTPRAAAESLLWALQQGQVDALARMVVLSPTTKTAADALFSSLPSDTQSELQSPENMMALWTEARFGNHIVGYDMVQDSPITGSDNWGVPLLLQIDNGKTVASGFQLQRTEGNWQLVLDPSTVQSLANRINGPAPR